MDQSTSYQPSGKSAALTTLALLILIVSVTLLISRRVRAHFGEDPPDAQGYSMSLDKAHSMDIPYFVEAESLRSTLVLNNNRPIPTVVAVTVYSSSGEALPLPPIKLRPLTPERFQLKELLKNAQTNFSSGNIRVLYEGADMAVTTQVSIVSVDRRLSFESVEATTEDFATNRLDGILWIPDDETEASVALTNASSTTISVAIKTDKEQSGVSLAPRETRVVDLKTLVMNLTEESGGMLVTMEHTGAPGALIATGFALNKKSGFSSNLTFADCEASRSTRLAGAHVRLGSADSREGFKSGTVFRSPLLLANTMDHQTQARISVDYTIGGRPQRVALAPVSLSPREVKQIDLSKQMVRKGIARDVDDAGVDVSYDGMPGTVIGRLTSFNPDGNYAFDVPIKDPVGQGSGGYPWRLDNGYTTVVHLKNTLDKKVSAIIQLRYAGGSYNPDRLWLAPHQTVAVDIRQLRDSQKKDVNGGVMPREILSGQFMWYEEVSHAMIGRAELADIGDGIASSFSCVGGCPCELWGSPTMNPSDYAAEVGDIEVMFLPGVIKHDCHGNLYGPYSPSSTVGWQSSNTSVATVDSSGNDTAIGLGDTAMTATWSELVGYGYNCSPIYQNVSNSGQCHICTKPTGETTSSYIWDNDDPTIRVFRETLLPTSTDFSGRQINETDPGGGGPDTCWFSGSEYAPIVAVSGGPAITVHSGNTYDDDVGFLSEAVSYYRSQGRASPSCGTSYGQRINIYCGTIATLNFKYNTIQLTMTPITVTSVRDGVTATRSWP